MEMICLPIFLPCLQERCHRLRYMLSLLSVYLQSVAGFTVGSAMYCKRKFHVLYSQHSSIRKVMHKGAMNRLADVLGVEGTRRT